MVALCFLRNSGKSLYSAAVRASKSFPLVIEVNRAPRSEHILMAQKVSSLEDIALFLSHLLAITVSGTLHLDFCSFQRGKNRL